MPDAPPAVRWSGRVVPRFGVCVVLLAMAAVAVSIVSLELIHPALSWNRDEPVYLWHVGVLESGRLTAPTGGLAEAFRPWLSGVSDGGYFSQYTLGWPLILLASTLAIGTPAGAVVLGTVLAVVGTVVLTRELSGDERTALLVGACFLVSPAVVLQAGVHLGYLFTVGVGDLALASGLVGLRRGNRLRLAGAGLLLGWILVARPFDAVLWGGVLCVATVVRHRRNALLRLWPVVVGGVPFVAATIAYNLRITGEALTFPIVATDPLDTFGFGERRLMPGFRKVDYDLGLALWSTFKNTMFFGLFLAGNAVTCGLAVFGAWRCRRRPLTWTLLTLAVAFPAGYFFFWGTNVSSFTARLVGSIYYVPSILPVVLLACDGARELRQRWPRALRLATVAALVLTLPVMVSRIDVARRISRAQEPWAASVQGLDGPALVIVASSGPYLLFANPVSRNEPGLDGRILYATDLGIANFDTLARFPDRSHHLQIASAHPDELAPREDPIVPTVDVVPLAVVTGTRLSVDARFTPLVRAAEVVPFVEVGGVVTWVTDRSTSEDERPGDAASYTFEFGDGDLPAGRSIVRVGFGAGDDTASARREPRIRWEVVVERTGSEITAIVPAQQFVRFPVGDDRRWYPRPGYPGAAVEVSVDP